MNENEDENENFLLNSLGPIFFSKSNMGWITKLNFFFLDYDRLESKFTAIGTKVFGIAKFLKRNRWSFENFQIYWYMLLIL